MKTRPNLSFVWYIFVTSLTAATNDNLLPAFGDLAPETKIINARKLMFVPFPIMHLLLEKNFAPRQAFLEIYTFLEINNVLTAFSPLLDFLRIASTADNTGAPANMHLFIGPMFRFDKKIGEFHEGPSSLSRLTIPRSSYRA